MVPRYLQETVLNLCIIIGAIVGILGIVFLCWKGISDVESWICLVLGAAIFFGFLKVRAIQSEHEKPDRDEDTE